MLHAQIQHCHWRVAGGQVRSGNRGRAEAAAAQVVGLSFSLSLLQCMHMHARMPLPSPLVCAELAADPHDGHRLSQLLIKVCPLPEAQRREERRGGEGACVQGLCGWLTLATWLAGPGQKQAQAPVCALHKQATSAPGARSPTHPSLKSASNICPPLLFTMNTSGL